jgi:hypothetical protein
MGQAIAAGRLEVGFAVGNLFSQGSIRPEAPVLASYLCAQEARRANLLSLVVKSQLILSGLTRTGEAGIIPHRSCVMC